MPDGTVILWSLLAALWLTLALIGWDAQRRSPRPDVATALAAWVVRAYCRVVHRATLTGGEHLQAALAALRDGRGVVIVANHTGGIDPILIRTFTPTFIRWVAAGETIAPGLRDFVAFADVVLISGADGKGNTGLRDAVKYLKGDPDHPVTRGAPGVIGLFPEGRIVRRPSRITPFQPGIGLLIGRSNAVVLPVVLRGVPVRPNTYQSFFIPSRSTVECHAPIDYAGTGTKPAAIAADLQARYERWIGPVVPPITRDRK